VISAIEEEKLWGRALEFLERGRPGDVEHTRAVLAYGKVLLANEGGDPLVVIPTLILHDVGWGRVDFSDFIAAPAGAKKDVESINLHMRCGARIASDILNDLRWDSMLIQRITAIIAVHDNLEQLQALNDLSATLVFEADWLDKFSPARQERYFRIVRNQEAIEELRQFLDENKSRWFRTKTAKRLLVGITSGAWQ